MVKVELPSSGTESDTQLTPLAASTQKTPPKKVKPDSSHESDDDDDSASSGSEDVPNQSYTSSISSIPKSVQNTKEKYLDKFPSVRLSKPKYNVDIDLSDSSDEVWIIKCPSSIEAKKVLLGSKFENFSLGSVTKISSPKQNYQLEGVVVNNDSKKPVTIMAGTEFKSFVPVGTIQIREAMEMDDVCPLPIKGGTHISALDDNQEIPFPEDIRDIHPLLGFDYKRTQKLPKHVKKALSLARQRSEAFYLQKEEVTLEKTIKKEPNLTPPTEGKMSKKRKRDEALLDMDFVDSTPADDAIQMMIKEEAQPDPLRKKAKRENTAAAEDDLSWLNDM
ncbi:uncharacterized protein LOC134228099 [Armigeres subalbatus]|uniref:uncharacterized protein LOC134228099 n=1 Tax=Armigeres subalbatus TaxID=124917 RepID=UPI002ED06571